MEVDRTVQSRRVNYINNPTTAEKITGFEAHTSNKEPRLYNIETFSEETHKAENGSEDGARQ